MIPTFYHSGELGDLIYGLKAPSRLPKSDFFIGTDLRTDTTSSLFANPNKTVSLREYTFIRSLLERQPYLNEIVYGNPEHIDYNLNDFRREIFKSPHLNFSDLYIKVCNFPLNTSDAYTPWLYSDIKKEYPITVIRVPRRTHDRFPWKQIVQKYNKEIIFLGTRSEYELFVEHTNKIVAWKDYTTLLSICEVINGAKLHIGNSTSMTVCAEAFKKPIIYENEHVSTDGRYSTCNFHRNTRLNVDPDISSIDTVMEKIETFLNR